MGAGLWWSSALLGQLYYNYMLGSSPSLHFEYAMFGTWAVVAVLMMLGAGVLRRPDNRRLVAYLVATVSFVLLSLEAATQFADADLTRSLALQFVLRFFFFSSYTALLYLWGVRFALLNVKAAAHSAFYAFCVCLTVTALVGLVPYDLVPACRLVCNVASAVCFLWERDTTPAAPRRRHFCDSDHRRQAILFITSRCLAGLAIGLSNSLLVVLQHRPADGALKTGCLLMTAGLGLAFIAVASRSRWNPISFLPLTPLAGIAPLALIFLYDRQASFAYIAPAGICLAWMILSSARLSELKETLGRSEVELACLDKLCVIVTITLGIVVRPILTPLFPDPDSELFVSILLLLVTLAGAGGVLLQFTLRQSGPAALAVNPPQADNDPYDRACDDLAARYKLTSRELDVLRLIGLGHSRPFVCETLHVSDGTARTHIRHIYAKLAIHRKDDLLATVQHTMEAVCR
jgi:DNA-binding CsgD family transcriptional regulator